jgi:hypothetical protein
VAGREKLAQDKTYVKVFTGFGGHDNYHKAAGN